MLEIGARINPLLTRTWFLLGCAEMRKERPDWKSARDAFAMCVAIDDEDAESWNNLATVYLRMEGSKNGSVGGLVMFVCGANADGSSCSAG